MTSIVAVLALATSAVGEGAAPAARESSKDVSCAEGTSPMTSRGRPPPPPGAPSGTIPPEVNQFTCKDSSGKKQGPFVAWTDAGVVMARGGFVDDKPDGTWTFYGIDGSKSAEMKVSRGVPSGDVVLFYPSGKVRGRAKPSADGKSIVSETFYESGIKASVHVIDRHDGAGQYTGWHENGTKSAEGHTSGAVRQGVWHEWDEKGKLSMTTEYDDQGNVKSCKGPGCAADKEPGKK